MTTFPRHLGVEARKPAGPCAACYMRSGASRISGAHCQGRRPSRRRPPRARFTTALCSKTSLWMHGHQVSTESRRLFADQSRGSCPAVARGVVDAKNVHIYIYYVVNIALIEANTGQRKLSPVDSRVADGHGKTLQFVVG